MCKADPTTILVAAVVLLALIVSGYEALVGFDSSPRTICITQDNGKIIEYHANRNDISLRHNLISFSTITGERITTNKSYTIKKYGDCNSDNAN